MTNVDELSDVAQRAAEVGARVAVSWQRPRVGREVRLVREKSGPRDLVSQADTETERAICEVIGAHRPSDHILGEELGSSPGSSPVTWIIDPIDGTTSYLYDRADWSVSIAAVDDQGRCLVAAVAEPAYGRLTTASVGNGTYVNGVRVRAGEHRQLAESLIEINLGRPDQHPVAGAMIDALMPRVRDVRRGGSAASALAHVAAGRADAAWIPGLNPWDGMAGILLAREAGCMVGDLAGPTGNRWPLSGDILAAPRELWRPLRKILATVY